MSICVRFVLAGLGKRVAFRFWLKAQQLELSGCFGCYDRRVCCCSFYEWCFKCGH
jgi:hypothetical protein